MRRSAHDSPFICPILRLNHNAGCWFISGGVEGLAGQWRLEIRSRQGQAPHEIGRAQFGRISIANTDSEAIALMDAAFDAAWRAVEEQT